MTSLGRIELAMLPKKFASHPNRKISFFTLTIFQSIAEENSLLRFAIPSDPIRSAGRGILSHDIRPVNRPGMSRLPWWLKGDHSHEENIFAKDQFRREQHLRRVLVITRSSLGRWVYPEWAFCDQLSWTVECRLLPVIEPHMWPAPSLTQTCNVDA